MPDATCRIGPLGLFRLYVWFRETQFWRTYTTNESATIVGAVSQPYFSNPSVWSESKQEINYY